MSLALYELIIRCNVRIATHSSGDPSNLVVHLERPRSLQSIGSDISRRREALRRIAGDEAIAVRDRPGHQPEHIAADSTTIDAPDRDADRNYPDLCLSHL